MKHVYMLYLENIEGEEAPILYITPIFSEAMKKAEVWVANERQLFVDDDCEDDYENMVDHSKLDCLKESVNQTQFILFEDYIYDRNLSLIKLTLGKEGGLLI